MKVVAQLSGGLDSAVATALAATDFGAGNVAAVFYNYGQSYLEQERRAAREVASTLQVPFDEQRLPSLKPDRDYFPLRNVVFAAHSASLAQQLGADFVYVGSKSAALRHNDPWSFADSAHGFFSKMNDALAEAWSSSPDKVGAARIVQPLCGWSRAMTWQAAEELGLPPTWSCYVAADEPCGKCYHCREDAQARGHEKKSVLLVGQAPAPGGAGERRAFEDSLSGARLERLIGCQPGELLSWVDTANVSGGARSAVADAVVAGHLLTLWHDQVVLCGSVSQRAFGLGAVDPLRSVRMAGKLISVLPHPSGLCRWWNDGENVRAAAEMLREVVGAKGGLF